ncbi:MAG: hypothetical protein A2Y74_00565 [Actinobacteria bacterium RBG_13_63_9]|nr:MAG: hypothetical protein A2Y74_00565 [Actinobacteria bacterium RBG_13_63_9]
MGLLVLFSATAGVAHAADGAVPGDTLYGLDCALEDIGIGNGGLQERLREASDLAVRGQSEQGLSHASEAFSTYAGNDKTTSEITAALAAAANAVQTASEGESGEIRARVTEMLQWMATTEATGNEFGQSLAERARRITGSAENGAGGEASERAPSMESEEDPNTQSEEDPTGQSEGTSNGRSANTPNGPPTTTGKP